MRLLLTLVIFVMAGATLTGSLVTALLAGAVPPREVQSMISWVAIAGFVAAIPISYFLAMFILKKTNGLTTKS